MEKRILLAILILFLIILSACTGDAETATLPAVDLPQATAAVETTHPATETRVEPGEEPAVPATATAIQVPPAWSTLDERARLTAFYSPQGVFLAYADGTNPVKLGNINYPYTLKWSPNGEKLVFTPDQNHFVIVDLGRGVIQEIKTTDPIVLINWHPASVMIAVMFGNNDEYALYDTGIGTLIRWLPGAYMSFSPDGTRAAWSNQDTELFIQAINVDPGSGLIEDAGEPVPSSLSDDIGAILVNWSPRGDLLVFTGISRNNGTTGLYAAPVEDRSIGNAYRLTGMEFSTIEEPRFSPDGGMLAFPASKAYTYEPPHMHIIHINGSGLINLTDGRDVVDYCPDFSEDSSQLTFSLNGDLHRYQPGSGSPAKPILEEVDATCQAVRPGGGMLISTCAQAFTRLEIGGQAIVGGEDPSPNRVRAHPEKGENVLSSLAVGAVMTILEGPVCADGFIFWRVENETIPGGSGWTAEGDGSSYWLEPYEP